MKESLESLQNLLSSCLVNASSDLSANIEYWLEQMEPVKYACLGCDYCFPAVAMNIFHQAFPEASQPQTLGCAFEVSEHRWPPLAGEYYAFCDGRGCSVAVSTLASVELAERLARIRPKELCIVGKTETENIGVDKVVKNTVTNPTIRFLLLAGKDSKGHQSGRTLLALWENGVDEKMKVIGSPGRRPVLKNVAREEVEAFRKQVQIVDMMGCEDEKRIAEALKELPPRLSASRCCEEAGEVTRPAQLSEVPTIHAEQPAKVEMDKGGYFVIIPQPQRGLIIVEHYAYDNRLLRVIEGRDAKSIYWTVIQNNWITQLSHAAYLGKELMKAELSMSLGFKYVQGGG